MLGIMIKTCDNIFTSAKTSDIGLAMKYYQNQDLTIFLPHIVNYPGWQTSPERQSAFKDFTKQILEGLTFLENQKVSYRKQEVYYVKYTKQVNTNIHVFVKIPLLIKDFQIVVSLLYPNPGLTFSHFSVTDLTLI